MGLLDGMLGNVLGSVLGGAMGGGQQAQDPKAALVQGVLGMLLNQGGGAAGASGGLGALAGVLGGALGGGQSGSAGGAGALGGLLEAFTKNGMGEQAGSWVGTGQNMPISADQLSQVLGSLGGGNAGGGLGDILGQLAGQAGVSREDAAGHLSEMLPSIVDKLTPNGQMPDAGNLGDLGSIMQQVLGK